MFITKTYVVGINNCRSSPLARRQRRAGPTSARSHGEARLSSTTWGRRSHSISFLLQIKRKKPFSLSFFFYLLAFFGELEGKFGCRRTPAVRNLELYPLVDRWFAFWALPTEKCSSEMNQTANSNHSRPRRSQIQFILTKNFSNGATKAWRIARSGLLFPSR